MPVQLPHVRYQGMNGPRSDAVRGLKMTQSGPPGHSASLKQSVFNSQKALTYAKPMKIRQA
jgi:hypothetical protein